MTQNKKSSDAEIQNVLNTVNSGFETSGKQVGVLAGLFRQLCNIMSVRAFAWASLMEMYLSNPANGIPQNSKDRATARGNLTKELLREHMSWKVFLKAVRFLGAIRAEFTIKIWVTPTKVHEATVTIVERMPWERIKQHEEAQRNIEENHSGLNVPLFDDNQRRVLRRKPRNSQTE